MDRETNIEKMVRWTDKKESNESDRQAEEKWSDSRLNRQDKLSVRQTENKWPGRQADRHTETGRIVSQTDGQTD